MLTTDRKPFRNLGPLTGYLAGLEAVTSGPTDDNIALLTELDARLTERTVLYPVGHYEHDLGYAVLDYTARTVSDRVTHLAWLALHEPNHALPPLTRRAVAQAALVELGRHIPLSGAIERVHVQPALEAVNASLAAIGETGENPNFADFGRHLIRRDLYADWQMLQVGDSSCSPLPPDDVLANITEAWKAIGWPVEVSQPAAA